MHLRLLLVRVILEKHLKSGYEFGLKEVKSAMRMVSQSGLLRNLTDDRKRRLLWAGTKVDSLANELD